MSEEDPTRQKTEKTPKFKKGRKFSRTSAVARLPRVIRDKVDQMIDDGALYKDICKWVKQETGVQLNHNVLSTWRHGGHERWLAEKERVRDMRETREFAREVMRDSVGKDVAEAGLEVAASQLYEILVQFNVAGMKRELKEQPEDYAKVVQMLARVSEGGLKYERHRAEVEKDRAEKEARVEQKAEESDEEMDEVLRALRVM